MALSKLWHPLAAVLLHLGLLLSCQPMDWLLLGSEAGGLCRAGFMNLVILKDLSLKSLFQFKQFDDSEELLLLLSEKAVAAALPPQKFVCSGGAPGPAQTKGARQGSVCPVLQGGRSATAIAQLLWAVLGSGGVGMVPTWAVATGITPCWPGLGSNSSFGLDFHFYYCCT